MDLAKIRRKSNPNGLQNTVGSEPAGQPAGESGIFRDSAASFDIVTGSADVFTNSRPERELPQISAAVPMHERRIKESPDPLAAILEGRRLASVSDSHAEVHEHAGEISGEEYLSFKVGSELYGVSIMSIEEIIKPREVTEVPCAPPFVTGILSLRGTIIPVLDMLLRLGLDRSSNTGKERVVVVRSENSFSGLLVDEVVSVIKLDNVVKEPPPAVLDGIDREFVLSIGRVDGKMIILLKIEAVTDIGLY